MKERKGVVIASIGYFCLGLYALGNVFRQKKDDEGDKEAAS